MASPKPSYNSTKTPLHVAKTTPASRRLQRPVFNNQAPPDWYGSWHWIEPATEVVHSNFLAAHTRSTPTVPAPPPRESQSLPARRHRTPPAPTYQPTKYPLNPNSTPTQRFHQDIHHHKVRTELHHPAYLHQNHHPPTQPPPAQRYTHSHT